ncbi:MAG: LysM peptidoglycan-binding domain-containing protein [Spirochaetales bacterium]|nr:LysM peptidoglycan-binding domain-containing protein [Spirochaetales bacterium]
MHKIKMLLILSVLFFFSCASAPEETITEPSTTESIVDETTKDEPVITTTPVIVEEEVVPVEPEITTPEVTEEIKVETIGPEPLDENLISNARKEIFKAEQAKAKTYYPVRLNDLKDKLSQAISLKDSDPDRSRELLSEISIEADKLTKDSLEALKIACINILNDKTEQLLKIKADKYTPSEFGTATDQKNDALIEFENGDFTKSLELYRVAYTSLTNLYNSLKSNLTYIESLLKKINSYKVQGESINVKKWALEEYNLAVESYLESEKLIYRDYNAVDGELKLRETILLAKKAIKQAEINIEVAETDQEIFALMNDLEKASALTVLDKDDNIIEPTIWEGSVELKDKPIEAVVEPEAEDGLTPIDLNKDVEVEYPEVSYFITENETKVLGIAEERRSLLAEAKDLWSKGIEARNSGDLVAAKEYLAKSKIYLDEYKSMAVDYIYTVVLNPEKRDCLWRIAEKDEFYGNPFLWQNIWERNKKLIQDPDLIYPGWKLIIPPLDEE